MNSEIDFLINALSVIVGLGIAVLLLACCAMKIDAFAHELSNIKREIRRTRGGERKYWKREKRRIWWSFLTFRFR